MSEFKLFSRAVILNNNNKVLLVKNRPDHKYFPNVFLLPGGNLNFGEGPIDALKRELLEEVNLEILDTIIIGYSNFFYSDTQAYGNIFLCKIKDLSCLKNMEPEKHDIIGFYGLDDLPDFTGYDVVKEFLENIDRYKKIYNF